MSTSTVVSLPATVGHQSRAVAKTLPYSNDNSLLNHHSYDCDMSPINHHRNAQIESIRQQTTALLDCHVAHDDNPSTASTTTTTTATTKTATTTQKKTTTTSTSTSTSTTQTNNPYATCHVISTTTSVSPLNSILSSSSTISSSSSSALPISITIAEQSSNDMESQSNSIPSSSSLSRISFSTDTTTTTTSYSQFLATFFTKSYLNLLFPSFSSIFICTFILFLVLLFFSFQRLQSFHSLYFHLSSTLQTWRLIASFHVTRSMYMSIALSIALGTVLGIGVGVVSGLEPAVIIGVSASMAMGCVFVMSFAILQGVHPLRAISFAIFVSLCLPFGFGFGFGFGILVAIACGIEDPDDIRDRTKHFITYFMDFVQVVAKFTLDILKL